MLRLLAYTAAAASAWFIYQVLWTQPAWLQGFSPSYERTNILLLGIGGDKHTAGNLADSIMVASIDPESSSAMLLSLPRDTYIDIPGYGKHRLNVAHALGEAKDHPGGGVALIRATVEQLTGLSIHHHARVDFQGFVDAIDLLGGVDVELAQPLYDAHFEHEFGVIDFTAGRHHMDGTTALYVSRSRKTSPRGDFDRATRQRAVLHGIWEKTRQLESIADAGVLANLIATLFSHVKTDINLLQAVHLYQLTKSLDFGSIQSTGLNDQRRLLKPATINGAAVMVPVDSDLSDIKSFVQVLLANQ